MIANGWRLCAWRSIVVAAPVFLSMVASARADLLTDPNDPRTWQSAGVGTFAQLYFGSNTLATRQMVIDQQLLDDGLFNFANYTAATLISPGGGGGCLGRSLDLIGAGTYDYTCDAPDVFTAANSIDNLWFQTSGVVGETVFDLGAPSEFAAVFNTIDHGPLPLEAIESTVYLSNDQVNWVQAVTRRVWLEGWNTNLGIKWDGFTYVVGTPSMAPFRYASITHGGPGALQSDGDNEINGVLGLHTVPEPGTCVLVLAGLAAMRRRPHAK